MRKNKNADHRKPEILESYYQVMIQKGIEGTSISKIAERLDIHPSLIIHYFKNKENMKLEHRLSYMALIGTISPMVGLFGTVHGMIASFSIIAVSESTPKASDLAKGISTALFTTLLGLFIAIPAIAAYNILRNRISRLVQEGDLS